jgi:pimeloyl-ACP methyl ester carboxylesterase
MNAMRIGWPAVLLACITMAACSSLESGSPSVTKQDPIIFVHGNSDNSSLFITTAWRFESNGWPADRLFAFDLPSPVSRDLDDVAQPGRSSAQDYTDFLSARIAEVLHRTGATRVILIGNSRGGYPIRRVIKDGDASKVAAAILGGTPNHGVFISSTSRVTNEYNGAGPWLTALNAPQGSSGMEVTPGVPLLTLRSDGNDKYAQPIISAPGQPDVQTKITADGPALRGAKNLVLPGVDHRETIYSSAAFKAMYDYLTGELPTKDVVPEREPIISGHVYAIDQKQTTNLPLAGTKLVIYLVDPTTGERRGPPVFVQGVAMGGAFGPVTLESRARYEFVLSHQGYATTHIYPGALLRSTRWLNLTLQPEDAKPVPDALVTLTRISGYFNTKRDHIDIDGQTPPAIITPIPTLSSTTVTIPASEGTRAVAAHFNGETIVVRAYPNQDGAQGSQRVVAELLD